ncbi:MAG: MIP/aquaporin family protein [Acidobacteriaceae bacterium]
MKALLAEFFGTLLLVTAVVGSGIMAERLANGNIALALLANSIATGGALVALILAFAETSGAHFNPAVTLSLALSRTFAWRDLPLYALAQCAGGVLGTVVAHLMFSLAPITLSRHARIGFAQLLSEFVATFGLVLVIHLCVRHRANHVAFAVAAYIIAAYWFTSSTSFANPAVTLARALTDTFAGIEPNGVLPFIAAQLLGAVAGVSLCRLLGMKPAV